MKEIKAGHAHFTACIKKKKKRSQAVHGIERLCYWRRLIGVYAVLDCIRKLICYSVSACLQFDHVKRPSPSTWRVHKVDSPKNKQYGITHALLTECTPHMPHFSRMKKKKKRKPELLDFFSAKHIDIFEYWNSEWSEYIRTCLAALHSHHRRDVV